jgi:hypothetical protein
MSTQYSPISQRWLLRLAMVSIVFLALSAGYYKVQYDAWKGSHIKVLEKFGVYTTKELLALPSPTEKP